MVTILIVIFLVVVLVNSIQPARSTMSWYELERRIDSGDKAAKKVLEREQLLPGIMLIRHFLMLVLALVLVGVASKLYGLAMALFLAGLVAICLGPISKVKTLTRLVGKLYQKLEPPLLKFVAKFAPVFNFFQDLSDEAIKKTSSKEELQHQIELVGEDVVGPDEKTIILSALKFSDKQVCNIMVPVERVEFVESDEILGPLVLDRLHQTTFSLFPVTKKDQNHVVGILSVKELLTTDIKSSLTAERAMVAKIHYIRDDHSLEYALSAFARTGQSLFVVINKDRETMGVLTLRDLMESLLGKPLKDDFDADHDKKAVAARPNNRPRGGVDV
ncbi:MAG: CBS domain-containing protein [Candidatus Nomurabacteria bacterium]|jgi:CBS domain containing-hemolysin-like protein|nr:CBS domain-containing protein [Candidatus Nomurabacteria bacterium]